MTFYLVLHHFISVRLILLLSDCKSEDRAYCVDKKRISNKNYIP